MDEEAKDEIIKHVRPEYGLDDEIDRVLRNNDNLADSSTWTEATPSQKSSIKSRMVRGDEHDSAKFKKKDQFYIEVNKGNYKKVLRAKGNTYTDENGNVYYKGQKGHFQGVIDHE